jgi:hypothetical protein
VPLAVARTEARAGDRRTTGHCHGGVAVKMSKDAELAAVRADITRTAAVVQALQVSVANGRDTGVPKWLASENLHQLGILLNLLARERELMAAFEPDEQKENTR